MYSAILWKTVCCDIDEKLLHPDYGRQKVEVGLQ